MTLSFARVLRDAEEKLPATGFGCSLPPLLPAALPPELWEHRLTERMEIRALAGMTPRSLPTAHTRALVDPIRWWTPEQQVALREFRRLGARHICPSSTPAEVKRAWRTLAKALHPDMGRSPDGFIALSAAWEALSS